MKYAVWIDGVILKIDLTDILYNIYKGTPITDIPITTETFEDWKELLNIRDEIYLLSPYDEKTTKEIVNKLELNFPFISNNGKTKPSKAPYEELFRRTNWDPLNVITIGSSPLDLLSARFYDSRIKVVCIERFRDCSRYSPYLISKDMSSLINSLRRLRKI
ncbi:hypothetical protein [Sulfurisphaera tokodaii]|uniref:HAD family hydrolase n=2 Tax=Sulfurisphaera tokodaii TaxID=111955 RepID=Q96ZD8_SULTO|nr:hypothetical protein [Sulfurisphaera tokodaii]BAB66987.1 hypothetical protein STK_18930 [Sulfurisphaera tokodaii str. 7]HII75359.1 HAD family hydrolase [Sulfurisphaera tokodaii]